MAHFTYAERQMLENYLLIYGKQWRKLGRLFQRNHTVIKREVERNSGHFPYNADRAQLKYEKRLLGKKKHKLEQYPALKTYVIEKLREDWRPAEIAGRLRQFEHRKIAVTVSHETIYQFIYTKEGRFLKLAEHLYTGRGKRRTWRGRRKKERIPHRVSIHERSTEANSRLELGHWETDLMLSSQAQKECFSVDVERVSRYTMVHKVENKSSKEKKSAIQATIDALPLHCFKSITYDNGTENIEHTFFQEMYDIDSYFCDPYCSWQKGTVENTNKLLRQYLPRNIRVRDIPHSYVQEVMNKLNNRPRKCLNYLTPKEVLLGGAFIT